MNARPYQGLDNASVIPENFAQLSNQEQKDRLEEALIRLTGESISYKVMKKKRLKEVLLSLSAQLAPFYMGADGIQGAINNGLDKTDVGYHTFVRLWEVFSNVAANGTSSDADNQSTSFNHAINDPAISGVLSGASVVPAVIGAWIHYIQIKKARERQTIAYNIEKAKAVNGNQDITEKECLDSMQHDFLDTGKVSSELKADAQTIEKTDQAIGSNKFANFVNKVANSKAAGAIASAWNYLATSAIVFWPLWMIAVLVVGFAASYALPVLPIVVGLSFVVAAAIKIGMDYKRRKEQKVQEALNKGKDPAVVEAEQNAIKNEAAKTARMRDEITQRFNMKQEHGYFKKLFAVLKLKNDKTVEKKPSDYKVTATEKDKVIVFVANNNIPANKKQEYSFKETELEEHRKNINTVLSKPGIAQHLLGSKAGRVSHIVVSMINTAIGNYTLSAFVLWLVGSALFAIGLAPGIIAAGIGVAGAFILGSIFPAVSTAFNVAIGGLYSLKTFADARNKQLAFEKDVYLRLTEEYKPNNTDRIPTIRTAVGKNANETITNQDAFDYFYTQVEAKKNSLRLRLKARQIQINQKLKDNQVLTDQEKYLLNYDLDKVDVYNDRYFRTKEVSPSMWTMVKKAAFRLYKSVNAAQTLIFITRSLFLAGAALAGVCLLFGPAAGIAFVAIAAVMAVVGVTLKLTQMYMDKKAADKTFFVETFPARISYLKKKDKQLQAIDNYLKQPEVPNVHSSMFENKGDQLPHTPASQPAIAIELQDQTKERLAPNPAVTSSSNNTPTKQPEVVVGVLKSADVLPEISKQKAALFNRCAPVPTNDFPQKTVRNSAACA